EAIKIIQDVCHVHKLGGFQICNWVSNSEKINASIDDNLKSNIVKNEFSLNSSIERVLGVWWNFAEDVFVFKLKFEKIDQQIFLEERRPTKRDILKVVMSIFDPLGLISNFIIIGKILMQNIWENGLAWDDAISDSQYVIWKNWCQNFNSLSNLKIPRMLTSFNKADSNIQLHLFCDASQYAYAVVAYLRFDNKCKIECSLINSKARV
ncbi:MAG TPA: hypothetical protein DDZ41_05760, partial [Flavobacterium sp.]|nr:hypothetical protein [Flavobacterium sp.]